jgi:hypothetical protein
LFEKPWRVQEETAESEWEFPAKSAASTATAPIAAANRSEVRKIESQARHVLEICAVKSIIESGIYVVAAANYAPGRSRTRDHRATSTAWPAPANIHACGSGTDSRHHHSGAASRYRRGNVCATATLRGGKRRKRQYHHCCY